MKVLAVFLVSMLSFLGTACVLPEKAQDSQDVVEFSTRLSDETLTIECKPRSEEIVESGDWVDQCNELGRSELDSAAASGLIAPVKGPAFGMASQFIRQLSASASISERTMRRDIPLMGESS